MQDEIQKAVEVLKNGGLILYPTDTIWGIGCDATNEDAVSRIYKLKQRIDSKSMLILIDTLDKLQRYVKKIPDIAYDLIELSDKPLTIIYDDAKNIAANLIAPDGSIGIRVTKETFSNELCYRFNKPIVSTSANISGEIYASNFCQIQSVIKNGVDYIVSYRQNERSESIASSIIKIGKDSSIKVIRK